MIMLAKNASWLSFCIHNCTACPFWLLRNRITFHVPKQGPQDLWPYLDTHICTLPVPKTCWSLWTSTCIFTTQGEQFSPILTVLDLQHLALCPFLGGCHTPWNKSFSNKALIPVLAHQNHVSFLFHKSSSSRRQCKGECGCHEVINDGMQIESGQSDFPMSWPPWVEKKDCFD